MKSQTEGKKELLRIVFEETTNDLGKDRRYIAKSYTGGSGWGVYDVVKGEFLSKEITELNDRNVRELISDA
jgi:hypothetical protein